MPSWEDENPPVLSEGLSWYIKGPPPVHRVYYGGVIYETPYALAPGETAPDTPGSTTGTTETFYITTGTDDQYVYGASSFYPPAGMDGRQTTQTSIVVKRSVESGNYWIDNTLLKFDTSTLPDAATILSATLRLYVQVVSNADTRSLRGEYYTLVSTSADWTSTGTTGITAFDIPLSSLTPGDMDIPLTSANLSNISKTGITGFRLHISGGQPSGMNSVEAAAFEHSTSPEARLIVTYT